VVVFLFRPGIGVSAEKWACPRAKEGVADCKKRFWSDAGQRRSFQAERREQERTKDTFACRFYNRIAAESPCEKVAQLELVRVFPQLFAKAGNVLAYAERLDSHPFPETSSLSLGSLRIEQVWSAPNGRIYFIPPRGADGPYRELSLTDTAQTYALKGNVSYTGESLPSVNSLVSQMTVLREATQLRIEKGKEANELEKDVRLRFDTLIFSGHRRFEEAMNQITESHAPATEQEAIVDEIVRMVGEHGRELDRFRSATFPSQGVSV